MINDMNITDNYRHIEGPHQNCEGEKIENQILIAGGFDLYIHHYLNPQPSNGCKKVSYCTRVKWTHLSLVNKILALQVNLLQHLSAYPWNRPISAT